MGFGALCVVPPGRLVYYAAEFRGIVHLSSFRKTEKRARPSAETARSPAPRRPGPQHRDDPVPSAETARPPRAARPETAVSVGSLRWWAGPTKGVGLPAVVHENAKMAPAQSVVVGRRGPP